MRERPDGLLEAETFAEHMAPDVHWIDNPEFAKAFDEITSEDEIMPAAEAGFTKTDPTYPGYVNVKFEDGKTQVTVRADASGTDAGLTASLKLDIDDWDDFIAQVMRAHPGGLKSGACRLH